MNSKSYFCLSTSLLYKTLLAIPDKPKHIPPAKNELRETHIDATIRLASSEFMLIIAF